MKKLISILLLICFTSMFITACDSKNENNAGFESEDTTIILNLDNYKQFLSVSVNASSGNPVELANWFVEAGGFVQSFPDSGYTGNAAE